MENRTDITVPMPERMVEEINGQLEYGDSRAAWIREAVRAELQRSGAETDCTEEKKQSRSGSGRGRRRQSAED